MLPYRPSITPQMNCLLWRSGSGFLYLKLRNNSVRGALPAGRASSPHRQSQRSRSIPVGCESLGFVPQNCKKVTLIPASSSPGNSWIPHRLCFPLVLLSPLAPLALQTPRAPQKPQVPHTSLNPIRPSFVSEERISVSAMTFAVGHSTFDIRLTFQRVNMETAYLPSKLDS